MMHFRDTPYANRHPRNNVGQYREVLKEYQKAWSLNDFEKKSKALRSARDRLTRNSGRNQWESDDFDFLGIG